jgi:hypothetical protein
MQSQVAWLQYNLNTADANETAYPNVSFKYVTAKEAMQLALGFTDFTSPTFTVTSSGGTYTIVSSEPVWKNHPYIALKYTDGTYGHMSATPTGTNTWTVTPPTSVSVVGVAGSDLYGNPGTATFTQYALTVETVGSGSVAKSPDQIMYASGTVVTLAATPQVGWSFNHWGGDASGTVNLITVNMTIDKTVTATFTPNKYSLTVTPVGSGSVNLNNSGPYYYGDAIQLAAVPNTGWSFDHWSEDLTGSINPTTILIDGNKAVTATFARIVYTLTIHTTGSGSVSTDKSAPYYWGDVVQLTASPATGWSFQYWGGDLSGSANVAMITMKADHDVTANFINKPTLSMDPTSKTCRMYGENFNVTITVSNAANVAGFAFEVKYNTTLLDYVGSTWNVWSPGTITADEVGGKITVSNSGTPPISGTQTLVTITFTASIHHIRKSVTGYTNDLTDTIYFQSISIDYTSGPSLQYSRGDSTQINVGPDFAYIFSPIQGDIDNNGVVDVSDLRTLAFFYDTINTEHNLIGDNTIDIFDLVVMAANFGYTYFP